MPELVQITENVYYLNVQHANCGIVKTGSGQAVVIDSGMGDESAKIILAAFEAKGLKLAGIINTHSHADHYGGNHFLVKKTGCTVYAPPIEAAIMNNPSLESFYIYGAYPPGELRQPFLMGNVSPVDVLLDEHSIKIGDKNFNVIQLKGHSPNQVGIIADEVFFCSDSVFSEQAWQKLVLVYGVNIAEMVGSLERLKRTRAETFVPSHVAPLGDITELADYNLARIQALIEDVVNILRIPSDTATVLWKICGKYSLSIRTLQQYYLCLDTLKAYLSYLLDQDLITYEFDANRLMWQARD